MWHTYLENFFEKYDYPKAGGAALLKLLDTVCQHPQMLNALQRAVSAYEGWEDPKQGDIQELLDHVRQAAQDFDFQNESAEFLMFLLMCPHLEQLYRDKGLPEDWFSGVARDLRSKLNECYTMRGIWGSFVANWFVRFFAVDRFVIGRLQFELTTVPESYCAEEYAHLAGKTAVNVHIPSGAPLRREAVQTSMAEAARFFASHFPDGKVMFVCHSWLLFPGHLEMLPETGGIRQFMEEFTIAGSYEDPTAHDLWRIFDTANTEDIDALPRNTSLQRAYAAWLKAGKPVGGGFGIRYIKI